MSRGGRMLWSILVLAFWAVAFVIGTAIPGVGSLSGLVAAVCIFQCKAEPSSRSTVGDRADRLLLLHHPS